MTIRSASLLVALAATVALAACDREPEAAPAEPTAPSASAAGDHEFQPAITADDFSRMVQVLASDEFEGRAPGSPGGEKTVEYIRDQFERIGLQPGIDGQWFQTVPMVATTADESTVLVIQPDEGESRELAFGEDMVVNTRSGQTSVKVEDSELVFVAYSVNETVQDWTEY